MTSYDAWRQVYVKPYKKGLYVAYNLEDDFKPKDSVTVSEASGYMRRSRTRSYLDQLARRSVLTVVLAAAATAC